MDGGISSLTPEKLTSDTDPEELARILGTSYRKIKYFYYDQPMSAYYRSFSIPKKSGGVRTIFAPSNRLKVLQARLKVQLSNLYLPSPCAKAFLKDTSIVSNANAHIRKKFVFNLDLKDFFPTISFARVRGLLISKPYCLKPETASVIAHLATINGNLPQGAPCSPVISNMMCSSLDRELRALAIKHRANYTRYADDITFSFYTPMEYLPADIVIVNAGTLTSHHLATVGPELLKIISGKGFQVNFSKVRLQRQDEKQVVTGLLVNKKVNVERRYIRKVAAQIHSMMCIGLDAANAIHKANDPDANTTLEGHVFGKLLFIKQVKGVDSSVYRRLAMKFNQLDAPYKVPLAKLEEFSGDAGLKHNQLNIRKCWVLENEDWGTQATGFMLENNIMVTCAHAFNYKLNEDNDSDADYMFEHNVTEVWFEECVAYRANERSKKYAAKVLYMDRHRDVAIISIVDADRRFEFFRLEENIQVEVGDRVSVFGFPNQKPGSTDVCRFWADVNDRYVRSMIQCASIDKVMYAGNSGGPVLNLNQHVVGIVRRGAAGDPLGTNEFVCSSEIFKVLEDMNKVV
ncbi:trypsin-like serine protease [Pseudomonas sp. PB106]|nr:trypsin-like serine protease [Pseudomonas sp. PB106]